MTPEDLRQIREQCERSSPGPWIVKSEWTSEHSGADVVYSSSGQLVCQCDEHDGGYGGGQRNVEFLAAARSDIPALLALVDTQHDGLRNGERVIAELVKERDAALAERDQWRTDYNIAACERDSAGDELAMARPVIKAAERWAEDSSSDNLTNSQSSLNLGHAVIAYRKAKP